MTGNTWFSTNINVLFPKLSFKNMFLVTYLKEMKDMAIHYYVGVWFTIIIKDLCSEEKSCQ